MQNECKYARARFVVSILACCLAVCAVAASGPSAPPASAPIDSGATAVYNLAVERRFRTILPKLDLSSVSFGDATQFFRDVSNLKIHVKWDVLRAVKIDQRTHINVRLHNITVRKALDTVLDDAGGVNAKLAWRVEGRRIVISTAKDLQTGLIARAYNVTDLVAGTTTQPVTVREQRSKALGEAVDLVIEPAPLAGTNAPTWEVTGRKGRVSAVLPEAEHRKLKALLAALRWRPKAVAKDQPVRSSEAAFLIEMAKVCPKVHLPDIGLADALQFIRDIASVGMTVHWAEMRNANVDDKTRLTFSRTNISIGDALTMILMKTLSTRPLDWAVLGHLAVSTREHLETIHLVKVYDVGAFRRRRKLTETEYLEALNKATNGGLVASVWN